MSQWTAPENTERLYFSPIVRQKPRNETRTTRRGNREQKRTKNEFARKRCIDKMKILQTINNVVSHNMKFTRGRRLQTKRLQQFKPHEVYTITERGSGGPTVGQYYIIMYYYCPTTIIIITIITILYDRRRASCVGCRDERALFAYRMRLFHCRAGGQPSFARRVFADHRRHRYRRRVPPTDRFRPSAARPFVRPSTGGAIPLAQREKITLAARARGQSQYYNNNNNNVRLG